MIDSEVSKMINVPVPFDQGWKVYQNGDKIETYNQNGFLSFRVEAGQSKVVLYFFPKGLKSGLLISAGGFIILAILIIKTRRKSLWKSL